MLPAEAQYRKGYRKAASAEGAEMVVIVGRRADKLQSVVDEIGKDHACAISADVSSEEDVKTLVAEVEKRFGKIDVLANIAGISGPSAPAEDYSFEDFKRVYEINVFGTFLMMKYCIPVMKKNGNGRYRKSPARVQEGEATTSRLVTARANLLCSVSL